ncbi:hypothetical protein SCRES2_gp40 [Synechococcus phage S-CRES2]|nr:hypothetical protein SCRES2_gp40 [Synechococcus phage S-CRES2]
MTQTDYYLGLLRCLAMTFGTATVAVLIVLLFYCLYWYLRFLR